MTKKTVKDHITEEILTLPRNWCSEDLFDKQEYQIEISNVFHTLQNTEEITENSEIELERMHDKVNISTKERSGYIRTKCKDLRFI